MIKMDQRGQISIEYILLVAVILVIVVIFGLIISSQNEENNVASAVQLGATNATAIVFSNSSQSPVRVTDVTMTNNGSTNINIVVHFSSPVTNIQSAVIGNITKSLVSTGYTNISNTSNSITLTTSTQASGVRHIYNISLA
jgi:uncharacterized protein (UPF0333 family)